MFLCYKLLIAAQNLPEVLPHINGSTLEESPHTSSPGMEEMTLHVTPNTELVLSVRIVEQTHVGYSTA